MTDQTTPTTTVPDVNEEFGSFTDAGEYIPRTIVEDDLGGMSMEEAIAGTIVEFEDGDIVEGV
ncbi:MAG: hypothetical protein AAGA99_25020, partial [Actinomycetota bacterium]